MAKAQSKYYADTSNTTFKLADQKYDGLQKLHPSDQKVGELARRRGSSGIGQRNYSDTAQNATDRLHYQNVESKPLSYEEAQSLAIDPQSVVKRALTSEEVLAKGRDRGPAGGAGICVVLPSTCSGAGNDGISGSRHVSHSLKIPAS